MILNDGLVKEFRELNVLAKNLGKVSFYYKKINQEFENDDKAYTFKETI